MSKRLKILLPILGGLIILLGVVGYFAYLQSQISFLSVSTKPSEAIIFVDEKEIGRTPIVEKVPAGKYHLRLEKEGFKSIETEVELLPRQNKMVGYNLEEQ